MDKSKIYGIEFDEAVPQGGEKRICDAADLQNDYVIGTAYQNGGRNDFDAAYPFGAMRMCHVRMVDGKKSVNYHGMDGNAMVEIPKFYSKREKIGTTERWMISGTCHPGFSLEPAFLRGGKELAAVYVGVYNTQNRGDGVFSASGEVPDVGKPVRRFEEEFRQAGYDPYDLAVFLMLQKLIVIEFGTRFVKQHLGGVAYLGYFSRLTENNAIVDAGKNYVTRAMRNKAQVRVGCFAPGLEVCIGHAENEMYKNRRRITKVCRRSDDPTLVDIFYDGEDLSHAITVGGDAIYGVPQKNGLADELPYHTGRTDFHCLDKEKEHLVNAFRYRGIENVWGNVWEHLAGLRIANLQYSYTFDPELYDKSTENWKKAGYCAPEQHFLAPKSPNLWIDSMGYDEEEPLLLLPQHSTGTAEQIGVYYDSAVYAYRDKDYAGKDVDPNCEWGFSVGGGFDHAQFGSLFTYRGFMNDAESDSWLYSHRVCLRR